MSLDLKWGKLRPAAATRGLLDQAVASLNQDLGVEFRVIKQPFGKIIACQVANVWLLHVGDGGRPPQVWTLAVPTDPGQRSLLPAQKAEDFEECCELLGFHGENQRTQFKTFLSANTGRALASTAQGAF